MNIMYCLDCMFKHTRDLEHHAEDAVRVTAGEDREYWEGQIDHLRELRKFILSKMQRTGATTCDHKSGSCSVKQKHTGCKTCGGG